MENLNAEQIKEDIDNCLIGECELCSYYDQTACKEYLMRDALALINSQEQRIKELTEENERLRAIIGEARGYKDELEQIVPIAFANEKADALNTLQTMFAMRFGTYTDKDMTPITEVFRLLDQISEEIIKETK